MNTTITPNMHELALHDLEQVAGGGKYNPNRFFAAVSPLYLVAYTVGYYTS